MIRWIFLILLFSVSAAFAATTGKIAGRVLDAETGEPLVGANIVIQNTNRGAAADAEGEFYIINVPPGSYSVVARMIGYTPQRVEEVRVSVDLTSKVNFELRETVLEAGEEVVVTAHREIQKDLTSSEVSISSETIEDLPVRSVSEMLSLQAGITRDASGSLHIRGGRTNEITYMVDGVQVLNPLNRSSGISIDDQAIEELKAITGTFNAEYGQALSGVVNIVTKKATDKFTFNLTGYLGDYFSFDNDVYHVNKNEDWVHAAARALNRRNDRLDYDLFQYFDEQEGFDSEIFQEKPWLQKEGYLDTFNPLKSQDLQVNMSGPVPFTNKRLSFFVSGRYNYSPGYQHGMQYFMPGDFKVRFPIQPTSLHLRITNSRCSTGIAGFPHNPNSISILQKIWI
ncbi:MAG: TonB-dependent receptor [candidate division KSB1 bacterium]|nr:TonB-dependent receptor [candidate division KSB1 bacterium]